MGNGPPHPPKYRVPAYGDGLRGDMWRVIGWGSMGALGLHRDTKHVLEVGAHHLGLLRGLPQNFFW